MRRREGAQVWGWCRPVLISCCTPRTQTFETTIRILGGLISAFYHSDGDELFLRKAIEFGER